MRICLAFLLLISIAIRAEAQREIAEGSNPPFKDRLYFGGGFGINGGSDSYGNRYFFLGLYPMAGYMVNNQFSLGTSITYQYYSYPDFDQNLQQYGVSPFARYNFGSIFLYSEYMMLNSPTFISAKRTTFHRLLLGVGYSLPIGKHGSINAMGLYDVLWNRGDYAFASPWVFRVFFSF